MTSIKKGFTLMEMLVVVAMIGILLASFVTAVQGAQQRARIQKAKSEVKIISQAVMGYENVVDGYELPAMNNRDVDKSNCGFLLGKGKTAIGTTLPVLLMASLSKQGVMRDPWMQPYKLTIKKGQVQLSFTGASGQMTTSYVLPNIYRLKAEERK